ncbi:MAG: hypothetical protein IT429_18445 [Gemmataceae bacterium]|nr:hypothetical protein [Gemmataceae bacterium]
MVFPQSVLAYIGPETILPATSILAAVGGIVLAFWQSIAGAVVRAFRFVCGIPAPAPVSNAPTTDPVQDSPAAPAPAGQQ